MSLTPFYAAPIFVKIHILAALLVATLTPLQFWGFRKGSFKHRVSGYGWLSGMVIVAVTSFSITSVFPLSFGGYGFIHLLSVFALFSSWQIVRHARAGNISAHRSYVIGLAIGFWIAGVFTLITPRIMGRILFG
ncbi:MAG: DUF2306 domain-containing protein [Rhabdaerophilum sp.]